MNEFPHFYKVKAEGEVTGKLIARAEGLPDIEVAPPMQFGGPGDQWSPEDLFMASIANCLVLSFKAIARASKFEWSSIECESVGELNKVDRKVKFTSVLSNVRLCIPENENKEKAERLLIKADETCLVSNSLSCESRIECEIIFDGQ